MFIPEKVNVTNSLVVDMLDCKTASEVAKAAPVGKLEAPNVPE